jgi:hypothetical protein
MLKEGLDRRGVGHSIRTTIKESLSVLGEFRSKLPWNVEKPIKARPREANSGHVRSTGTELT